MRCAGLAAGRRASAARVLASVLQDARSTVKIITPVSRGKISFPVAPGTVLYFPLTHTMNAEKPLLNVWK